MTSPIVPSGPDSAAPNDAGVIDTEPEPEAPAVPGAPSTADGDTTSRRRRIVRYVLAASVLAAVVVAVFAVRLPYYVIQPGKVHPAERRIEVVGAEAFEADGDLYFTTITQRQATVAWLIHSLIDDAVVVRTRDEVFPDGDSDEERRMNFLRMDLSKLVATRVALEYVGVEARFVAEGARVLGLSENSASEGRIRTGDVIVSVDGADVGMPSDIAANLADREPGDTVAVVVTRPTGPERTERVEVEVTLGSADDGAGGTRPVLGVEVEPANPSVESDVEISVDSGTVSGPSAGLAWTLGIIDRLTPGSVTGGRRVAVTGEIRDDGSVGPVGGLPQKVSAVKRAGISLFIYPASTPEEVQAEMRRIARDDVRLEAVDSLDQAVKVLVPEGIERG